MAQKLFSIINLFIVCVLFSCSILAQASGVDYYWNDGNSSCLRALTSFEKAWVKLPLVVQQTPFLDATTLRAYQSHFDRIALMDPARFENMGAWQFSSVGRNLYLLEGKLWIKEGRLQKIEWKGLERTKVKLPLRLHSKLLEQAANSLALQFDGFEEMQSKGKPIYFGILVFRYMLSPGYRNPGYPWHVDGINYQVTLPIRVPTNIRGGRFFVQPRPSVLNEQRPVATVQPASNRAILLDGLNTWHAVEEFEMHDHPYFVNPQPRDMLFIGFAKGPHLFTGKKDHDGSFKLFE